MAAKEFAQEVDAEEGGWALNMRWVLYMYSTVSIW